MDIKIKPLSLELSEHIKLYIKQQEESKLFMQEEMYKLGVEISKRDSQNSRNKN